MAQVRVPRKGVTQAELAGVLSRRLGAGFEVVREAAGEVLVRRTPLSAAVVRISYLPGATVFRVRGAGFPVATLGTVRLVTDALRRSPEFRSVLPVSAATGAQVTWCAMIPQLSSVGLTIAVISAVKPRYPQCVTQSAKSFGATLMPASVRP